VIDGHRAEQQSRARDDRKNRGGGQPGPDRFRCPPGRPSRAMRLLEKREEALPSVIGRLGALKD
jgi:hypothetical protein